MLYEQEYGWNIEFEVLVARVATEFFAGHDGVRERCWIAERDGPNGPENIGRCFSSRIHADRELPSCGFYSWNHQRADRAGEALVEACTHFAITAGYHTITLWTNSVLVAARGIYEKAGYRIVDTEAHHSFGKGSGKRDVGAVLGDG
jgi:RimJ/RimL family protein N-acetyltransferase